MPVFGTMRKLPTLLLVLLLPLAANRLIVRHLRKINKKIYLIDFA